MPEMGSVLQWTGIISLGGLVGAMGQGARAIVGIKKTNDFSTADSPTSALLDGSRLFVSFGIGAVAGAFAAITIVTDAAVVTGQQIFALAAAGYAGSDFVEGFIQRITPATSADANVSKRATVANSSNADDAVG